MIEIRVEPAGYCTRRKCLFCGEFDNKDSVIAAVYEDGEKTGYIVCPDYPARAGCVSATPAVLAERLRARAAEARVEADALEAIAADLPAVPTMAALQAVTDQFLDEMYGPLVPDSAFNFPHMNLRSAVDDDGVVF